MMKRTTVTPLFFCLCVALGWSAPMPAQEGRLVSHLTLGSSWFLDDDSPAHLTVGGSFRGYLAKRVSFEPEILYLRASESDQDYVFAVNVAYDLKALGSRATPYVVGGVGALHHRGRSFSTTDFTGITGVGVRLVLTDRVLISPRFRMGIEPNFYWLATVSLGIVLSKGSKDR